MIFNRAERERERERVHDNKHDKHDREGRRNRRLLLSSSETIDEYASGLQITNPASQRSVDPFNCLKTGALHDSVGVLQLSWPSRHSSSVDGEKVARQKESTPLNRCSPCGTKVSELSGV